ncbi:MAG: AsmA-like C-terminal region-containing protein [Pirellulaceae bacterium]
MDSPRQPDTGPSLAARLAGELKRLVVVGVLGVALFVAGKYYCVDRLNEEIRLRVEQQLRQHYRGLGVSLRSARRVAGEGVELRGLEIRAAEGADAPVLVSIDEVFAQCDTRLPDFVTKPPKIVRLHLQRLRLRAQREADGYWNLSRLLPLPSLSEGPLPIATISDASLEIVEPNQSQAAPLTLRNIELVVRPEAEGDEAQAGMSDASPQVLRVRGSLAGDHLEKIEIDGLLDPLTARWEIRGAVEGLEFSPRLRSALPREVATALLPLSTVRGRTYLGFHVQRREDDPAIEFIITGKISEGRIDDARLPEPLTDVEASIRADNHGIVVQDMSARCGRTQLEINAELFGYSAHSPLRLDIEAKQLELERLPVDSLPAAVQKVFADFAPRGLVDLTAHLGFDGQSWQPDLTIKCHDLSVKYHRFAYRLAGGTGTIELKNQRLNLRLKLLAGSQPIQCRADCLHPGPDFSGWVELQSEAPLPLDEKLLVALEPKMQKIVRAFRPRGNISFQGRLQRAAGEQEVHRKLHITLHDCSLQHDKFSYPIDKVNGSLQLTDRDWLFRNLTGRNDSASIVGEGAWLAEAADGNQLALHFTATDVPLADELRQALSPGAQRLWTNLRPRGNIDHLTIGLKYSALDKRLALDVKGNKWPPGQNVEGRSLSIEPTWFRYRLDSLTGSVHYVDGVMQLQGLQAVHGRATIEAEGVSQVLADGGCRLQLSRLSANRLEADQELLAALPQTIGQGLARLAVQGPTNVVGTLGITVPGHSEGAPEIDWDLTFDVDNGRMATTIPVEHIYGGVRLVGGCGPKGAFSRGELEVESAFVRGVQLTQVQGPLVIDGQRVIFGAAAERDAQGRVPRAITADAFDGQLVVNGELQLSPAGEFQVQAALENADLKAIVRDVPRQRGLSGKVFGVVNVSGTMQGMHTWRGNGQVRLRDADIYQLPVMIAVLQLVSVQRPDRTAFNTSNIDFRIEGDDLAFDRIDFNGDAFCLKGKGRMNGQRQIELKFYPQLGRDEVQLPFFRPLVGGTSRQFMLIEATGTLDRPEVNRTVFPGIDERLQELFPELARQAAASEPTTPILSLPREALQRTGLLPRR